MANIGVPKGQQTAYERWEMSSFSSDKDNSVRNTQAKIDAENAEKSAQIFDDMRKKGYAKGMQEGFAVGMAEAKERAQEDKQKFLTLMTAFSDALEKSDEQIADDVLSLALDVAKSMIKVKLNIDPAAVLAVVMDAIHYLPHIQKPARILLHHDDVQLLREHMADDVSSGQWQIHEDYRVERGGCIVETGTNQVDATNVVRWKRISEALSQHNDWLLP
ncbi:flagellar assembly protein FliH [mine drainage metagenome]|uniref:Flagellar assembly protein FliH n=1 Tax=mine drainage metagenome TaxID=410659 RepID=A0A1J5RPC5_9ZZZZ